MYPGPSRAGSLAEVSTPKILTIQSNLRSLCSRDSDSITSSYDLLSSIFMARKSREGVRMLQQHLRLYCASLPRVFCLVDYIREKDHGRSARLFRTPLSGLPQSNDPRQGRQDELPCSSKAFCRQSRREFPDYALFRAAHGHFLVHTAFRMLSAASARTFNLL